MKRIIRFGSLFILAIALTSVTLAQTTSGSIAGTIADTNQAAVANAIVKITDESKNLTLSATADSGGRFVFPQVPPGTYTLSAEATGFKKLERTGLVLVANDKLTLGDLILQVGAASETVTITAEATLIQAESAERSYAVQGEAVRNIAVNGRSFVNLASVATGVVFSGSAVGNSDEIAQATANGLRTSANNLQLDGVAVVDTGNNGTMISVNLDAVAEFKVLTSNYQAEFGRSAGAQISAVTRAGTKDFHGSFYTFRRHDGMNSNTWFNNRNSTPTNQITKPRLDQRDIGYTIGGPVYIPKVFNESKDKVFFFFSQEHQKRLTPRAAPVFVRVPTLAERNGDFSQSLDGSGSVFNFIRDSTKPGLCQATPAKPEDRKQGVDYQESCFKDANGTLGIIPTDRLFQPGLNILKMFPLPNLSQSGSNINYQSQASDNDPQRQDLYRGDWIINNSWRATGKYLYNKRNPEFPYGSFVLQSSLPEFPANFPNNRYSVTGTVTGSLSPTTVLEVTFGQSHNSIDILPANDSFNRTDLGLTGVPLLFPDAVQIDSPPRFCFGGGVQGFNGCGSGRLTNTPAIGSNNAPFYNYNTTRDLSVNLSKIVGPHNFKFGLFWQNSFKPQSSFANNNGQYDFSDNSQNPFDTQFGFANAATGVFNSFNQASDYIIGEYRYNNVEWYAQDNWKVTSRLTLDYGMRFYYVQPQFDESGQAGNFLPDKFDPAKAPRLFRPAFNASGVRIGIDSVTGQTVDATNIGRIVPGSGSLTNGVFLVGQGVPQGAYRNRGVQFAPRFGFAYDVFGDQMTVIRGGAGIFYDRPQGNTVFNLVQNPPTVRVVTLNFGRMQDIGAGQFFDAPPALVAFDLQGKVPTTYAYNLGVQYKLPYDAVLDVSYVGTSGQHLLQQRNINAPAYGAAFLPQNQDPTSTGDPNILGARALPVDFLRPYQGFGNITLIEPAVSSNYHSLQTSIQRRYTRGLLLGVNYTWSKVLGTQSVDQPGINGFGAPHVLDNHRANYGVLDFDRPHNFNVNFVWDVPKFTGKRNLGYALNGWQFSGIYRYQTGAPYNVTANVTGLSGYGLTGTQQIEGARLVLLKDPGNGNSGDPYRMFDTSAFAAPSFGSQGFESGRNFLRVSPLNSLDVALSKEFIVKERLKFEIRLDTFNALNHTQFDSVNTQANFDRSDPTKITNLPFDSTGKLVNPNGFGTVRSTRLPRNMQLSARFQF
ncbi:MAG TPA: TonB-dependent receptor [Blastocatellia bacterium]|nr:TonB-dependent receptor [Blastocatellia bacterium]